MLFAASTATPSGLQRVSALVFPLAPSQLAAVKSPPWPNTRSAVVSPDDPGVPDVPPPGANGLSYSSTRLLPLSATYRLPEASTATPYGSHRLLALADAPRLHR